MARSRSSRMASIGASALCAMLAFASTSLAGVAPAAPGLDTNDLLSVPTPTVTSPIEAADLLARQAQPTIAYVDGFRALGCFEDGGILTATSRFNSDMTPHNCRNWCSVQSAPFFGIKQGFQCFCGNEIEAHAQKADEDECTRTCFGASSFLCGAQNRLNLYAPTDADVGTFADNAPTVTPTGDAPSEATGASATAGGNGVEDDVSGSPTSETTTASSSPGLGSGPESDDDRHSSSSAPGGADLTVGAVIGIAVGAAAISGLITAVVACFFCRRRRRHRHQDMDHRMPPVQPMVYAHAAPANAAIPPPSPLSQYRRQEMHGIHKPHDGSMTHSYSLSPISASPPPVSAVSGSHELHHQPAGPYEMQGNVR